MEVVGGVVVYFVVEGACEVVTAVGFDSAASVFWGDRGEEVVNSIVKKT